MDESFRFVRIHLGRFPCNRSATDSGFCGSTRVRHRCRHRRTYRLHRRYPRIIAQRVRCLCAYASEIRKVACSSEPAAIC